MLPNSMHNISSQQTEVSEIDRRLQLCTRVCLYVDVLRRHMYLARRQIVLTWNDR